MRNKKVQICKEGKLIGPSQAGGDLFDTAVGTATDLFAQEKRALIPVPPLTEPRVREYNLSRTPNPAPAVTTNYSTSRSDR